MPLFKWNDISKNETPDSTGVYIVCHKNGNIESSYWDKEKQQWKLHAIEDSPITHWTDYKKLGKPFEYNK